jgi:hypothetical protein
MNVLAIGQGTKRVAAPYEAAMQYDRVMNFIIVNDMVVGAKYFGLMVICTYSLSACCYYFLRGWSLFGEIRHRHQGQEPSAFLPSAPSIEQDRNTLP